jgi:HJR/Mrr/RecB family endonuclease
MRDAELKRLSDAWLALPKSYCDMTPMQFESTICELFRKLGYRVTQTPFSNDGGKDAIAYKDGETFLIECKQYESTNR